ncbi:MAG: hypothetical protein AB8B92_06835 [Gammaproteobacteria bacterium]
MPNTIAHFAINGLFTRAIITHSDFKWIYLACVIPDLPWILQRIIKTLPLMIDLYDLRAYCIAQSSLLLCVFLCAALAMLAKQRSKVFIILVIGCLLHLLLDAVQTKWANGVLLFAPFDWNLLRFDFFWPESLGTYLITAAGLLYFIFNIRKTIQLNCQEFKLTLMTLSISVVFLLIWLTSPLAYMQSVFSADNHYISTLKDFNNRTGKEIEIDRNIIIHEDGEIKLKTSYGELITLENIETRNGARISLQGKFLDKNKIYVNSFRTHSNFRNYASMVGLACVLLVWLIFISRCCLIRRREKN